MATSQAREHLYARPKNGCRIFEPGFHLIPHRLHFSEKGFHSRDLRLSAAIFSAADLTSATRRPQPAPKTDQVLSDCREMQAFVANRSDQPLGVTEQAAATTLSVMVPALSDSSGARRRTLALRAIPELTPYSRECVCASAMRRAPCASFG